VDELPSIKQTLNVWVKSEIRYGRSLYKHTWYFNVLIYTNKFNNMQTNAYTYIDDFDLLVNKHCTIAKLNNIYCECMLVFPSLHVLECGKHFSV